MRKSVLKLDCNNEHLSETSSLIKKTRFELRNKWNMEISKMNVLGVFENDFIDFINNYQNSAHLRKEKDMKYNKYLELETNLLTFT